MVKETVPFNQKGIDKLPDNKPVMYKVLTDGNRRKRGHPQLLGKRGKAGGKSGGRRGLTQLLDGSAQSAINQQTE
jgi:hypothetical protein